MKKQLLLSSFIVLSTVSTFAQINVNSSGKAFFGNGPSTYNYGAINLTESGASNGLSIYPGTGASFRIFNYNDDIMMTRSGSIGNGMKMRNNGSIVMCNNGGLYQGATGALLTIAANTSSIWSVTSHSIPYGGTIKSTVLNGLTYAYSSYLGNSLSMETTFYVTGNGQVFARDGFIQSSDASGKTNIAPLKSSLDKISALSAVSFEYKDLSARMSKNLDDGLSLSKETLDNDSLSDGNPKIKPETLKQIKSEISRKRIGLIAQEVEKIVPEVVRTLPDGKKGIMYSDLVSLLIEGIKELQTTVNSQEERITQLEENLHAMNELLFPNPKNIGKRNSPDTSGSSSDMSETVGLSQNVPNPFNQETTINYRIPAQAQASICIYNLNGIQLKKYPLEDKPTGKIIVSASEFPAGIYLYSLIIDNQEVDSKRMVLTD